MPDLNGLESLKIGEIHEERDHMFNIADTDLFEMMCNLNTSNGLKKEMIETRFFLGLYKDIPVMVYRLDDFKNIPLGFRNAAMEDIVQNTQLSIYKNLDKFLSDPKSKLAGARVNYLKRIVYCRTRDWINSHYDEMNGASMEDIDKEPHHGLEEFDADDYIDIAYRLAKYLILFEKIDNKLLAKICFFYKDIEMKVNKSGKNGGLSGKNNVLDRLNGKMVDDIREGMFSEIIKVCPVDIPDEYVDMLTACVWKDKVKSPVFCMTYNYAVSACSRLKNELDFYENDIIAATEAIMEMFEDNHFSRL